MGSPSIYALSSMMASSQGGGSQRAHSGGSSRTTGRSATILLFSQLLPETDFVGAPKRKVYHTNHLSTLFAPLHGALAVQLVINAS